MQNPASPYAPGAAPASTAATQSQDEPSLSSSSIDPLLRSPERSQSVFQSPSQPLNEAVPAARTRKAESVVGRSASSSAVKPPQGSMRAAVKKDDWLSPATPLIALMGCKDMHRAIIQNIPSTHRLRFLSLQLEQTFPRAKPNSRRTTSYEGYQPDGIMKTTWIKKHRDKVPAVAVLFFEWDDTQNWMTQQQEVAEQAAAVRHNNIGRDIRFVILIVMAGPTVMSGELLEQMQPRFHPLAKACNVDDRYVFLLDTANLKNSLRSLEMLLWETAVVYYTGQWKRVKKLKDKLNKGTQPKVITRHHFKIAFFSEMCDDRAQAVKYYTSGYTFLHQFHTKARASNPLVVFETKTVAYLFTFRLIRLLLAMGKLQEAIDQFDTHVKRYHTEAAVGVDELTFRHYAWLSKQYVTMGQQLEAAPGAVRSELKSRSRNPGFYYEAAAHHSIRRNISASASIAFYQSQNTETGITYRAPASAYIGKPDVGDGGDDYKVDYALRHRRYVKHFISAEMDRDRSQDTIELLTKAYECFKMQKSTRMILHVAAQMATEYHQTNNYAMAIKFFERIAKTYRKEAWWGILTAINRRAIDCATHLNQHRSVIEYSLELLGAALHVHTNEEERGQLCKRLMGYLEQQPAEGRVHLPEEKEKEAAADFTDISGDQDPSVDADGPGAPAKTSDGKEVSTASLLKGGALKLVKEAAAQGIRPGLFGIFQVPASIDLIQASCHFSTQRGTNAGRAVAYSNETVRFTLYIHTALPLPITLSQVIIVFNHPVFNGRILNSDIEPPEDPLVDTEKYPVLLQDDLSFMPGESRELVLELSAAKAINCKPLLEAQDLYLHWVHVPGAGDKAALPMVLRCPCLSPNAPEYRTAEPPEPVVPPPKPAYVKQLEDLTLSREQQKAKAKALAAKAKLAAADPQAVLDEEAKQRESEREARAFKNALGKLRIVPVVPRATMSLSHCPPALVGEYYCVRVDVECNSDSLADAVVTFRRQLARSSGLKASKSRSPLEGDKSPKSLEEKSSGDSDDEEATPFLYMPSQGSEAAGVCADAAVQLPQSIDANSKHSVSVFLRLTTVGARVVTAALRYNNADGLPMLVSQSCSLPVVTPFAPRFRIFSHFTPFSTSESEARRVSDADNRFELSLDTPFALHVELENESAHVVELCDVSLAFNEDSGFKAIQTPPPGSKGDCIDPSFSPLHMAEDERHTSVFQMVPLKPGFRKLGSLRIEWRRQHVQDSSANALDSKSAVVVTHLSSDAGLTSPRVSASETKSISVPLSVPQSIAELTTTSPVVIPPFTVSEAPFMVELDYPASCEQGRQFQMTLSLTNTTSRLQLLQLKIPQASDSANIKTAQRTAVVFSGRRECTLRLLPHSKQDVLYNVAALDCGFVELPQILIVSQSYKTKVIDPRDFGKIFVHPRPASVQRRRESAQMILDSSGLLQSLNLPTKAMGASTDVVPPP